MYVLGWGKIIFFHDNLFKIPFNMWLWYHGRTSFQKPSKWMQQIQPQLKHIFFLVKRNHAFICTGNIAHQVSKYPSGCSWIQILPVVSQGDGPGMQIKAGNKAHSPYLHLFVSNIHLIPLWASFQNNALVLFCLLFHLLLVPQPFNSSYKDDLNE